MTSIGTHVIADFKGCDSNLLDDLPFFENLLSEAVLKINATILGKVSHKFEPQGLTTLLLLAESHCSAHNFPELGYCSIDIYTCMGINDPYIAFEHIKEKLNATEVSVKILERSSEFGVEIKEILK